MKGHDMLKKLLWGLAALIATMGFAFAQVDVNTASPAALDGIKGIGPKTSKAILDERKSAGAFKDWADFEKRVKGVGGKSADRLSKAGLTVNGKPRPNATAPAAQSGKKPGAKPSGSTTAPS
jgi:competence protein ComEA